jgi:hypothetical protein
MEIAYLYTEGNNNADIKVRMDGKIVGTIKKVSGGWQYFPLHHKRGGDIYATAGEVQKTLAFADDE